MLMSTAILERGMVWRDVHSPAHPPSHPPPRVHGSQGEPYIKLHIANTALHYGQSVFEGMKAFAWEDGSVHIFRPDENCARMTNSANVSHGQPATTRRCVPVHAPRVPTTTTATTTATCT